MEENSMKRLALTIFVLVLLACGGSDTAQTGDADAAKTAAAIPEAVTPDDPSTPPVAAAPSGAGSAAPEPTVNLKAASCLVLVSQAKFSEALPVCTAALQIDPDNTAVQAALDTAKTESATTAADAAVGSATGEASSRVDDLTGAALGGVATE
jgi:hypothetical protein